MIYWSFQSVLIMYYGKNCPNIGDEWHCWWEWPLHALPLWPEMDAPKTDMKARNTEEEKFSPQDAGWQFNATSVQYVPAMAAVAHIYSNVTFSVAMHVEIKIWSCNKGSAVGGLNRTWRRGGVFRHMDERRLESNQRVTKTGKQSVPINISWMTSL